MKRVFQVLSLIFSLLAIAGAAFVLLSDGTKNAGYAVVPMALSIALLSCYKICKQKEK